MRRHRVIGWWQAAVVMAAAGLVLLTAACGGSDLSVDNGSGGRAEAPVGDGGVAAGDADSTLGDGASAGFPSITDRKIVRTATLSLRVNGVVASVQQVDDMATAAGGFVSSSSVFAEPGDESDDNAGKRQTATVTVRVPAGAYPTVLSQLRGVAVEVRSETSEATEVTEEYTDLQSRLRNLEATERAYLDLYEKATGIPDILPVQDSLSTVRGEIEQVQEEEAQPGWAEEAWNEAWDASGDVLREAGRVAITAGVVLMWLGIPVVVLLGLAWRFRGGRGARKETA